MPRSICQLCHVIALWRAARIRSLHRQRASTSDLPFARSSTIPSMSGRTSSRTISPCWSRRIRLPRGGYVSCSNTGRVIVELEVRDVGRRCSYWGLLKPRGAKIRFGRHGRRPVLFELIVFFRGGGRRRGSPNRRLSSLAWWELRLWDARRGYARGWPRHRWRPGLDRNGRRSLRAGSQFWLDALRLLHRPSGTGAIPSATASGSEGSGFRLKTRNGCLAPRRGMLGGGRGLEAFEYCPSRGLRSIRLGARFIREAESLLKLGSQVVIVGAQSWVGPKCGGAPRSR